jgi:hypothetical protein
MAMRGRIRSVKPEIHLDEELWALGVSTGFPIFQGFQGLWGYADREKRFEWRPAALKACILPYWEGDMGALLDALAGAGFIAKYTVDGKHYGIVVNLDKHQRFNAREPRSELPPPPPGTPGTCTHVRARAEPAWSGSGIGNGIGIGNGSGSGDELAPDLETESEAEEGDDEAAPAAHYGPGPWKQYPHGWRWSRATAAAARARGVSDAELQETVDYWTTHLWGAPATDLDAELVRRLDGIVEHRSKQAVRGAPAPSVSPYRWAPTGEHRAFAKEHSLEPFMQAVEAYRAGGTPDKCSSTLRANDDFARRLKWWATSGEFVAAGPLPKAARARGAA